MRMDNIQAPWIGYCKEEYEEIEGLMNSETDIDYPEDYEDE